MKDFIKKYRHAWMLSYALIYLPWFIYLERTVTTHYHVMHIWLDDYIPFNEYFIVPYLLWFLYIAATVLYFFFTSKDEYYKLCIFLFSGMTISLIICSIYPNGTDLRTLVDPDKNVFSWLVYLLHQADTNTNVFPSIHVYNSLCVHTAISVSPALRKQRILKTGSFILMVLICLSTVFLKQHSAVDGFAAFFMATIIYPLVYKTDYSYLFGKKKLQRDLPREVH